MLPSIEFFRPKEIYAAGVGFKRPGNDDFQYYLPFVGKLKPQGGYGDSEVKFAISVTERRVFVASHHGEMALIDLDTDAVIRRAKLAGNMSTIVGVQISSNSRLLYVRGSFSLHIVDAESLDVLQEWTEIEHTASGWQRNTFSPMYGEQGYDVWRKKSDAGTIERIEIAGPVREIGGNRVAAQFQGGHDVYGTAKRTGYYVFDVASGAIERHAGAVGVLRFQAMRLHKEARAARVGGYDYNLKCPDAFEEVVAREAMITLSAASWSSAAAIGLVDDLAARMEGGVDALTRCGSINVRFVIGDEVVSNEAFFDRFVDERWVRAAPALRRLLTAYLNGIEGGEGCMPWHFQGGGSVYALRALMLLDPDAYDVYRLYLDKGDLEHDHGPYVLYEEYVGRHGYRNEADVGFGIYITMSGCMDTDVDPNQPIKAAERLMPAERLVEIIQAEAARFHGVAQMGDISADVEKNPYGLELLADYFSKLEPSTPYARKVISALPDLSFWRSEYEDD